MSVGSVTPPPGGTPPEAGDDQDWTFEEAEAQIFAFVGPFVVGSLTTFMNDVAKQNQ